MADSKPRISTAAERLQTFAVQLQKAREAVGGSQALLSAQVGIPLGVLRKYEAHLLSPSFQHIYDLCEALDVTPNQLLGYEPL